MPPNLDRLRKLASYGDDADAMLAFERELLRYTSEIPDPESLAIINKVRLTTIPESERPKVERAVNLLSKENDGYEARIHELTTTGLLDQEKGDFLPPHLEYNRYKLLIDLKENPEKAEIINRMNSPAVLLIPENAGCERVLAAYDSYAPPDFTKNQSYLSDHMRENFRRENDANGATPNSPITAWNLAIIDAVNKTDLISAYQHDLDGSAAPQPPIHLDNLDLPLRERIAILRPWQEKMKVAPLGPKENILLQLRAIFQNPPRPVDVWHPDENADHQDRTCTIQDKHYKKEDSCVATGHWNRCYNLLDLNDREADEPNEYVNFRSAVMVRL